MNEALYAFEDVEIHVVNMVKEGDRLPGDNSRTKVLSSATRRREGLVEVTALLGCLGLLGVNLYAGRIRVSIVVICDDTALGEGEKRTHIEVSGLTDGMRWEKLLEDADFSDEDIGVVEHEVKDGSRCKIDMKAALEMSVHRLVQVLVD